MSNLKAGIITVSDRVNEGIYKDLSGPAIKEYLSDRIKSDMQFEQIIVSDNFADIKKAMVNLCDKYNCSLVLTTGGTGPAPRDITPEVTELVVNKVLPGFGELMRSESLKFVPTAILSRQTAGIRNKSLVINLPGSPKAINQCLDAVFEAMIHCIKLIGGPEIETVGENTKRIH